MGVPRKIEMKLVKKKSARQVTFSKRRNGIFKKASELSILCGAIVAIIVFSPGGKSYAFGHPTIDYVINNFLHQGAPSPMGQNVNAKPSRDDDDADDDDGGGDGIESLNKELEDVMNKIQEEKDKGVKLDNVLIKKGTNKFIKGNKFNIDGVGVEELAKLKANLGDLIAHLDSSIDMLDVASSLLLLAED